MPRALLVLATVLSFHYPRAIQCAGCADDSFCAVWSGERCTLRLPCPALSLGDLDSLRLWINLDGERRSALLYQRATPVDCEGTLDTVAVADGGRSCSVWLTIHKRRGAWSCWGNIVALNTARTGVGSTPQPGEEVHLYDVSGARVSGDVRRPGVYYVRTSLGRHWMVIVTPQRTLTPLPFK